jgi:hypothetical protein
MPNTPEPTVQSVRATYQHKLDNLRGDVTNIATGVMQRRITTALHALTAPTPNLAVIQEQLEELQALAHKLTELAQPPK